MTMQSINSSTLFPPQSSATSVPLSGESYAVPASATSEESQPLAQVKNAGMMLSQALLAAGGDKKSQQLAARFERGDVSAGSLKQLVPVLESMSAGQAAQMSNALGQMGKQTPALQSVFQQLQEVLVRAQTSRQERVVNPQSALTHSVNDAVKPQSDFRSLVVPAGYSPVSIEQAEGSVRSIMNNPSLPLTGFINLNIEELALQAANLGIKTFGDTASAVNKSQTIATHVRKTLMDKQVEDFRKDLEKAIKQQENAKKGGIFGAILKWIMPVIAVVAMVFVPMSLPLMVGMIGATAASTVSAGLNTAQLVMGPNAPGWLQKLTNIMDWVSTSLSFIVGGSAMWLGEKVANGVIHGLELMTDIAQGVNGGVTGILNTKLQKEINELDLKMEWQEVLVKVFQDATENNSKRLEKATDSWSTGNQKLIDVMQENATLRARIAKSMI
ncbi:type III secretion system translocon subunit SctE [Ewingella americana]|uniref:type III secretion system translocon subunit SctE n=1 Tax=Ewingella americana TaxID=41202 RepID=UPI0012AE25C3|nr:type III secretion system translocon subunit SctE [Ewingella americana]MRT05905.1 YopB/SseC family type III secretion system translocon subunit [Ewingella americana]